MNRALKVAFFGIPLLSLCPVAIGAIVTYSDQTAFLTAAGPVTNINFGGIAAASSNVAFTTAAGLTISGVNFVGLAGTQNLLYVIDDTFCCQAYQRGQVASLASPVSANGIDPRILVTLPTGTRAVGFFLFSVTVGNGAGNLTDTAGITVDGNVFDVATQPAPARVFFGFTSTTDISSFLIRPTAANTSIDVTDFAFSAPASAAVPEPGSLALMLIGGVGLIVMKRSIRLRNKFPD